MNVIFNENINKIIFFVNISLIIAQWAELHGSGFKNIRDPKNKDIQLNQIRSPTFMSAKDILITPRLQSWASFAIHASPRVSHVRVNLSGHRRSFSAVKSGTNHIISLQPCLSPDSDQIYLQSSSPTAVFSRIFSSPIDKNWENSILIQRNFLRTIRDVDSTKSLRNQSRSIHKHIILCIKETFLRCPIHGSQQVRVKINIHKQNILG